MQPQVLYLRNEGVHESTVVGHVELHNISITWNVTYLVRSGFYGHVSKQKNPIQTSQGQRPEQLARHKPQHFRRKLRSRYSVQQYEDT